MAIALFVLSILALASLAPFYGADSRNLASGKRNDWYPTLPSTRP